MTKRMSNTKMKRITNADDYVATWRELLAATADSRTLLALWHEQRDQRDALAVPIVQRIDLLDRMAPEEVARLHVRPLAYDPALALMRKPHVRLVRLNGGRFAGFYVLPGGRVEDSVADKIIAHPLMRGGRGQTWWMESCEPPI